MTERKPITQTSGAVWRFVRVPFGMDPEPWMVEGKGYRIVLRRWSTKEKPEILVYDQKTGDLLATLLWAQGAEAFGIV